MRVHSPRRGGVRGIEYLDELHDDVGIVHALDELARAAQEARPGVIHEQVQIHAMASRERRGGGEPSRGERRRHRGERERARMHRLQITSRHLQHDVHGSRRGGDDARSLLDAARSKVRGSRPIRGTHRGAHGDVQLVHVHAPALDAPGVSSASLSTRRGCQLVAIYRRLRVRRSRARPARVAQAQEVRDLSHPKLVGERDVSHPGNGTATQRDGVRHVGCVRSCGDGAVPSAPVHGERPDPEGHRAGAASKRPAGVQSDEQRARIRRREGSSDGARLAKGDFG